MSQAFDDARLEEQLRAVLHERADEVAAHARTAAEVAADLAPRLRSRTQPGARGDRVVRLLAIAAALALLLAYLALGVGHPRPPIHLRLAVDMPLGIEPGAQSVVDAVRLAIQRTARPDRPFVLDVPDDAVFSDVVGNKSDAALGAHNVGAIIADGGYLALIGPYNSFVAQSEIPLANAAGMLECSPSNTDPGLTLGDTAAALRPRPDRPTYVRVAATDDAEAAGAARFLIDRLGARSVFVAGQPGYAGNRLQRAVATFQALGLVVAGTATVADPVESAAAGQQVLRLKPDAIVYDGASDVGAGLLRSVSPTFPDLPFVTLDSVLDGPRSAPGSFLNLAGPAASSAYAVFPASFDPIRGFDVTAAHVTRFGQRPGRFAFGGYACVQVIVTALAQLQLPPAASIAEWREALRRTVTEEAHPYETVLGDFSFDRNGDPTPARVSVYTFDPGANDWAFGNVVTVPGP
jgi:ABC-type branched-subunit amino acid transport system substrate-binding protein